MSPKILLRIAAGVLVVFLLGHTVGGMLLPTSHGEGEDAVLDALADYRFEIMGLTRSHMDFYVGEGWYLSLALAVVIALLWQLSTLAAERPAIARRLIVPLAVFTAGSTVLCALYFFAAPLATSVLATVALVLAWWKLGSAKSR